ncbi:sterol desaturase family protein [Paraburkholderia phosphatilytica]|uniref:sterol desaturase family protein n=1 Tax=Paraburkholderia phosphatilytica TaxID=2282883 RepID=UPI000E4D2E5F|nr:sterol desaturase family protein [Paraburkholderia phosphatilytica]
MNAFDHFLLYVATPAVVVFAAIEALLLSVFARSRQCYGRYDWRAFCVSTLDLAGRVAVNLLVPLSIAQPVLHWAYVHRLGRIHLDSWYTVLLLFIVQEFCYYWYHRAAHEVRWFWVNHAVHHSPNELNLSAAFRIGIFGKLTGTGLFFAPLVWMGFDPRIAFGMLSLNLLYQFWLHTTWMPRLGWLEGILNTPSAHRVHHATNLDYLDANYGGVLLVFDRLFGTYVAERDDLPCRYGLVTPMTSYNPLRVEFDGWLKLARDLLRARSIGALAGYLLRPPGWAPHGAGSTTADLRARASLATAGMGGSTQAAAPFAIMPPSSAAGATGPEAQPSSTLAP